MKIPVKVDKDSTEKPLKINSLKMEPMVRIELTTCGLRNRCSTTELHWLPEGQKVMFLPDTASTFPLSLANLSQLL